MLANLIPRFPRAAAELEDGWEWVCVEYIAENEVHVSPWFEDEFDLLDWLNTTGASITRKFVRTSDGIVEADGLGGFTALEPEDISACFTPSAGWSLEDFCLRNSA